ncbi:MAG: M20/M25/M40 family metallo-hydrolase [Candidatus Hodarchaeales archaeon]
MAFILPVNAGIITGTDSPNLNNWENFVNSTSIINDITQLASDECEGRYPGTTGDVQAQNFISNQLASVNAVPFFDDSNSMIQPFTLTEWARPVRVNLSIEGHYLNYLNDYVEATFTGATSAPNPSEIVFAGYGISTDSYDDYYGKDLTGKIALVVRGRPDWVDSEYAYTGWKSWTAANHGAEGLIMVNHPSQNSGFKKSSPSVEGFNKDMGIFLANRTVIDQYLDFSNWVNDLDSFINSNTAYHGEKSLFTGLTGTMEIVTEYKQNVQAGNVVAKFPGKTDDMIIVSAHYDHLGKATTGEIYRGADDDASGVAIVIETARILSNYLTDYELQKTIVFALWGAEEIGLVGSKFFINNLPMSKDKIDLVIQLDMVGVGPTDGYLEINGGDLLAENVKTDLQSAAVTSAIGSLDLDLPHGGSDHVSFLNNDIPAVLFFWDNISEHKKYHTVNDQIEDLNEEVLVKVTKMLVSYLIDHEKVVQDSSISSDTVTGFPALLVTIAVFVIVIKRQRSTK